MTVIRTLFFIMIAIGSLLAGCFVFLINNDLGSVGTSRPISYNKPSIVLDETGKEFARFELDRKEYAYYPQFPEQLIQAFIAAEDHTFFSHCGISWRGIIRSTLVNLYHRKVVQGASTITQQVARLLFLTHERTWFRKIRELIVALQLERLYNKEYIMELYLNNVYFGRGIYGVEAACQRFWKKSVEEINLDEAAVLAAVAKSARFYSPLNAPLTAQKRRNTILHSMKKLLFITDTAYQDAKAMPLTLVDYGSGNSMTLYMQETIRQWAEQRWGKETLYSKGLIIKTTLNMTMQKDAEKAFAPIVEQLRTTQGPQLNGGLVCLHAQTGAIRACIGGINFQESQYNRALQATRQIGSSFKPILYAAALCAGIEMDSVRVDEPLSLPQGSGPAWTPKNWTNYFEGPMTLARALTSSNNMISIKLLLELGIERVIRFARLFGITQELKPYPSLALGTAELTVAHNAAAFNVFANNGYYVPPFFIEWVKDNSGKKIWHHTIKKQSILNSIINGKMLNALSLRMELSKKFYSSWLSCESIGKTGSTNNAASTWFVGSTPDYTTAVYLGKDDNSPLGTSVYASKTAFPIWLNFSKTLPYTQKDFYYDPNLVPWKINWYTGQPATELDNPAHVVTIVHEQTHDW